MKATTLLVQQHRKVKATFKKLKKGGAGARALMHELANDLAAHFVIEQDIFYPAIKKIDEDLVRESFEEHALAEIALKRLLAADPKDPSFEAHVTATMELIDHHVEEEQDEMFPKVEKKLGDERLNELGAQMKARFEELVSEGFVAVLPKGFGKTSSDVSLRHL